MVEETKRWVANLFWSSLPDLGKEMYDIYEDAYINNNIYKYVLLFEVPLWSLKCIAFEGGNCTEGQASLENQNRFKATLLLIPSIKQFTEIKSLI